ncbi:MAG: histidine kinase [Chitinophagales bacterium]|nr:histidine kinase [Chitinophagaceae bacterium]MCB9066010.1 histidine kinase [Chitinophagales bacterium]
MKLGLSKTERAEKDIQKQIKYLPYFLIFDFALLASVLRFYLMPQWGWWHILLFLSQCGAFTGFWFLIRFINKKLNKVFPFEKGPFIRISLQILLTLLIILPVVFISTYLSRGYIPGFVNDEFMATMLLMVLVVVFMFNFAFYTFHFFEHWQGAVNEKANLEVQAAQLEREKSDLQYHQLRNQVNPHYLFNTLTSLDGLIQTNPDLASEFVRHMSKVYRYVLQHKESEVVSLNEETVFIGHYIELLSIRHGKGLSIHMNVSEDAKERGVVMVTLQLLIDNAIKHNVVQSTEPLKIVIWDEGDYLIVHNNKQLRKQIETSNGTGLIQLKQLYSYLTDKDVIIEDKDEHYTIKIPLL